MYLRTFAAACVLSSILTPLSSSAQSPILINFQGRLVNGTNLVNGNVALSLRLFDAATSGTLLYEDSNAVSVADGIYSTFIGDNSTFGTLTNALANTNAHLEVMVSGAALTPRERIASVAYALRTDRAAVATTVDDGAISAAKLGDNAVDGSKISDGTISNADFAAGSVSSATVADGGLTGADISNGSISNADIVANTFWATTGNTNTAVGTHFLGTLEYTSLEVRVSNARVARFEPATNTAGAMIPNVILGHSANLASNGAAFGSAIGGGGNNANPQIVGKAYDTVAGGVGNKATGGDATVAGGRRNEASGLQSFAGGGFGNVVSGNNSVLGGGSNNTLSADYSTVAGGVANVAGSAYAFIGGGYLNAVSNFADFSTMGGGTANSIADNAMYSVIAGGQDNSVADSASHATVGGGNNNNAGGIASTVPGGLNNDAANTLTFAAGNRAKASHVGSFVWADSTDADFSTTADQQFLIRASGGIFQGLQDTNLWRVTGLMVVTNANVELYEPIHVGAQLLDIGSNRIYYAVGLTTNDWKGAALN